MEMVRDVKQLVLDMQHVSYQTRCHDSYIDDHEIDIRELMGMADCIKEYLHKLIQMNQCNHCQDYHGEVAQPMEELFSHPACGILRQTKMIPIS